VCAGIDAPERADQGLAAVERDGLPGAALVLLAIRVEESVVGLGRGPAVDDEEAALVLDGDVELRAEVAVGPFEEAGPFALGSVGAREGLDPSLLRLVLEATAITGPGPPPRASTRRRSR